MHALKKHIVIVSPALKSANNGNWQTAYRWSRFLASDYQISLVSEWKNGIDADGMIALHARRSAKSIAAFAQANPDKPLVVVLTGTDLYQDIRTDASAKRSLDLATHLVVLQEEGVHELTKKQQEKCRVIYQSARSLKPAAPKQNAFDVIVVGHMRDVKDPLTPMRALALMPASSRLRMIHIGNALEAKYKNAAKELSTCNPRYLWLGDRPHAETRQRIKRAQVMVISSLMEGGANVIIEAITSGVPVIASRMSGNIGMLGRDYAGYFPVGDSKALAAMLDQAERDARFMNTLKKQCAKRMVLFTSEREKRAVNKLMQESFSSRSKT